MAAHLFEHGATVAKQWRLPWQTLAKQRYGLTEKHQYRFDLLGHEYLPTGGHLFPGLGVLR